MRPYGEVIDFWLTQSGGDMDIGPRERKGLNIGQLLAYLHSVGVEEPESVPICFSDGLSAVLATYDAGQGVLILSDVDEARLPTDSYVVGALDG
jgi:hypothetical protein